MSGVINIYSESPKKLNFAKIQAAGKLELKTKKFSNTKPKPLSLITNTNCNVINSKTTPKSKALKSLLSPKNNKENDPTLLRNSIRKINANQVFKKLSTPNLKLSVSKAPLMSNSPVSPRWFKSPDTLGRLDDTSPSRIFFESDSLLGQNKIQCVSPQSTRPTTPRLTSPKTFFPETPVKSRDSFSSKIFDVPTLPDLLDE